MNRNSKFPWHFRAEVLKKYYKGHSDTNMKKSFTFEQSVGINERTQLVSIKL